MTSWTRESSLLALLVACGGGAPPQTTTPPAIEPTSVEVWVPRGAAESRADAWMRLAREAARSATARCSSYSVSSLWALLRDEGLNEECAEPDVAARDIRIADIAMSAATLALEDDTDPETQLHDVLISLDDAPSYLAPGLDALDEAPTEVEACALRIEETERALRRAVAQEQKARLSECPADRDAGPGVSGHAWVPGTSCGDVPWVGISTHAALLGISTVEEPRERGESIRTASASMMQALTRGGVSGVRAHERSNIFTSLSFGPADAAACSNPETWFAEGWRERARRRTVGATNVSLLLPAAVEPETGWLRFGRSSMYVRYTTLALEEYIDRGLRPATTTERRVVALASGAEVTLLQQGSSRGVYRTQLYVPVDDGLVIVEIAQGTNAAEGMLEHLIEVAKTVEVEGSAFVLSLDPFRLDIDVPTFEYIEILGSTLTLFSRLGRTPQFSDYYQVRALDRAIPEEERTAAVHCDGAVGPLRVHGMPACEKDWRVSGQLTYQRYIFGDDRTFDLNHHATVPRAGTAEFLAQTRAWVRTFRPR